MKEKIFKDLKILFKGHQVSGWSVLMEKRSFIEKILKHFPKLWSWFFDKIISPHFYRGQSWMFDSLMGEIERYEKGEVPDNVIENLRRFIKDGEV